MLPDGRAPPAQAARYAAKRWRTETDEQGNERLRSRRTPERAVSTSVPAIVTLELYERVQAKLKQNQLERMAHARRVICYAG